MLTRIERFCVLNDKI